MVVEKVYKRRVKDMRELRERIVAAWNELDQRIIDTAGSQWCTRLRACVKALWVNISNTNCDLLYQISCTNAVLNYRQSAGVGPVFLDHGVSVSGQKSLHPLISSDLIISFAAMGY